MSPQQISDTIVASFKEKESFRNIGLDDDYFDLGISSLTVVGLQIKVEEKLGLNISTRDLMGLSTINQWVQVYTAKAQTPAAA